MFPKNPSYDRRTHLFGGLCEIFEFSRFRSGASVGWKSKHGHDNGCGAVVRRKNWPWPNVGDSRLYLVRDNELILCTTDHSFVQEQIDKGMIKRKDAEQSDFKNMLTRSVGVGEDVERSIYWRLISFPNDYILLCSDGLPECFPMKKILALIPRL